MAKKLLTTPKGVAVYPHLTKADTRFNKDGLFSIKLKLAGEDAAGLIKVIDEAMAASLKDAQEQAKATKNKQPKKVKQADPPYSEDEDGGFTFSFKMNAQGKTKEGETFTRQPVIFDSTGKPIHAGGLKIGGGSIVRVSYSLSTFFTALVGAGVSLRLAGVQIIKLTEWGADAEYYGFEDESGSEEGFVAGAGKPTAADEDDEEETAQPSSGDPDEDADF